MDDKQTKQFGIALDSLESVDGMLMNLKKRAPEAAKEAAERYKTSPPDPDFPWKNAATGAAKLAKAVDGALKAVKEVDK